VVHEFDDTCAIKSQQLILEPNGIDISEKEPRDESAKSKRALCGEKKYLYIIELQGLQ
jgi:hypothetical protein